VERRRIGRLEPVAFWLALAVAIALLLVLVGVITGAIPVDDPSSGETVAAVPTTAPAPVRETPPVAKTTPVAQPAAQPAAETAADDVVQVRAVGGDCWLEAREGSSTGPVLFIGLLARGTTKKLNAKRVWLRLGAGENVEIVAGGKRAEVPAGTSDIVLST
jgi:hypothetical protein